MCVKTWVLWTWFYLLGKHSCYAESVGTLSLLRHAGFGGQKLIKVWAKYVASLVSPHGIKILQVAKCGHIIRAYS